MNKISSPPPFFQYFRPIKSSPNCDIFKTVKYNSHQHFLFYIINDRYFIQQNMHLIHIIYNIDIYGLDNQIKQYKSI